MTVDLRLASLRWILEQHSGWVAVLEEFGIDGRGGDQVTLAAAAHRAGVDVAVVVAAMSGPPRARWDCSTVGRAPLRAVIDHVETVHHRLLRDEFPRIAGLLAAAVRDHPGDQRLVELRGTFGELRDDLEPHLEMEESVVFPICRDLADALSWPSFHVGPVGDPIRILRHDHDVADRILGRILAITGTFTEPGDEALVPTLNAIDRLAADLAQHLREENEVLFPAMVRLAEEFATT